MKPPIFRDVTIVAPERLDERGWFTVRKGENSRTERERDSEIERLLVRDGRPLSLLGIIAKQNGARWKIEIHHRVDMLATLDRAGRIAPDESDRTLSKELAAWIRGLPHGVCPEIFLWESQDGGGAIVQKATVERERGRR